MRTMTEPRRETPVLGEVDVLVVGGGPAGFAAATAAARLGTRTMLVERYGCLGGLATGGLVLYMDGLTDAVAPDDRMFDLDRLKSLLQACATMPADELCRTTFERLGTFRGAAEQADDMTMLVLQVARSGDRPQWD